MGGKGKPNRPHAPSLVIVVACRLASDETRRDETGQYRTKATIHMARRGDRRRRSPSPDSPQHLAVATRCPLASRQRKGSPTTTTPLHDRQHRNRFAGRAGPPHGEAPSGVLVSSGAVLSCPLRHPAHIFLFWPCTLEKIMSAASRSPSRAFSLVRTRVSKRPFIRRSKRKTSRCQDPTQSTHLALLQTQPMAKPQTYRTICPTGPASSKISIG